MITIHKNFYQNSNYRLTLENMDIFNSIQSADFLFPAESINKKNKVTVARIDVLEKPIEYKNKDKTILGFTNEQPVLNVLKLKLL